MLDAFLAPTTVPLLEQTAAFGERRHEVLVGNVANVDTPGYRRQDLDEEGFMAALKSAVEARSNPMPRPTKYGLPDPDPAVHFAQSLTNVRTAARANPTFQDGAERSVETDVLAMTRNLMRQSMSIELMASQMNLLASVISEQP